MQKLRPRPLFPVQEWEGLLGEVWYLLDSRKLLLVLLVQFAVWGAPLPG